MHVNDLEDIGISDPFPDEELKISSRWIAPEKADQYIYCDKKLNAEYIPICSFIPNK
jgi:hypothetical protein